MGLRGYSFGRTKASFNLNKLSFVNGLNAFPDASSTRKSGVFFKPDGTRCYTCADTSELAQYNFTTPWTISTIASNYLNTSQTGNHQAIQLGNNGNKLYLVNVTSNLIQAFNLTTAWDISTKTTAETTSIPTNARGISFKTDGTQFFIMTTTTLYSYSMSTPWDVSTKTLITSKDLSADSTEFRDLAISPNGINFYIPSANVSIKQYTASTAWDINTLSLFTTFINVNLGSILALFIRNDGKKLYAAANSPSQRLTEWNWS